MTQAEEVTLESLDNGPGLLPFKLGPTKLISHYHAFLQHVDLNDIDYKIDTVRTQLLNLGPQLNNNTFSLYEPHLSFLSAKLERVSEQVRTFEPDRVKRGLVDGLGSVIKSISGNLDYTDAIKYNAAIKTLENNENKLQSEFNNHISLSKEWMLQHSKILDDIVKNQEKIGQAVTQAIQSEKNGETELIRFAHLAQYLVILNDNVENLSEELDKLGNALALIRASSIPHAILSFAVFKSMLDKLKVLYPKGEILEVDLREYYDLIKVGSYYIDKQVVLVFKVPIAVDRVYDLYKLAVIPNRNHQVLIPPSPYIAVHEQDSMYMETECPKVKSWHLCEESLNQKIQNQHDCTYQLITSQQLNPSCKHTRVFLTRPAVQQLDSRQYVISLPEPTKIQTSCGQEQFKTIQGSYLVEIPHKCVLKTPDYTITNSNDQAEGHALKIMELPDITSIDEVRARVPSPSLTLNSINLENLHASDKKISSQIPVNIRQIDRLSLYHTTIPVYLLIFCACTVAAGITSRRLFMKRCRTNTLETIKTDAPVAINQTPDKPKLHPRNIEVNHGSAIFSKNLE